MNERLFTLVGAALALVLLMWLFGGGENERTPPVTRPTSQDAGDAGLLGLYRWIEHAGVPARRLRGRFSTLEKTAPAAAGNLLITADPMVWAMRPIETDPLRDWVRQGNHVLLLRSAGQEAARRRGAGAESAVADALGLETDWLRLRAEDQEAPDVDAQERQSLCAAPALARGTITGELRRLRPVPGRSHPVLRGVQEVAVKTPAGPDAFYRALSYQDGGRYWYPLLCEPQRKLPVFSVFRAGAGRVWALDFSETFSNHNLGRADNAQLFANLVALTLGPGGAVIFDDMHQGDSELYDPEAFFRDPRLHGTLAFLVGMWLLWLLGYSNRFGADPAAPPNASLPDFARAVGRFYARYLQPAETAHGLFRHFFNDVRTRYRLPPTGEPVWDVLERVPPRARQPLAVLRVQHERLLRRQRVDLHQLRNLLLHVRNNLT